MSSSAYQHIYKQLELPDLVELLDPQDFSKLQAAVESLSSLLEIHLRNQKVEINRFQNIEQFEEFLKA